MRMSDLAQKSAMVLTMIVMGLPTMASLANASLVRPEAAALMSAAAKSACSHALAAPGEHARVRSTPNSKSATGLTMTVTVLSTKQSMTLWKANHEAHVLPRSRLASMAR